MGLLSGLLGAVTGLFGGGSNSRGSSQPRTTVVQAAVPTPDEDRQVIAWWEGWQKTMAPQRPPTSGFDPVQALMAQQGQGRQTPAPMQATSNQRGGMASPGFPGMGLLKERQDGLGPGRGAGAGGAQAPLIDTAKPQSPEAQLAWHQALRALMSQAATQQYTAPLQGAFTQYQQQALSGNAGLSDTAYRQAMLRGQGVINAQSGQARQSLTEQMGQRGLLRSGLMSRGLRGVEEARLGSIGDLVSGLAQQDAQARVEAQRQASAMMPGLISAQSGQSSDMIRALMQQQAMDLQRGGLKLNYKQYNSSQGDAFWGALGSIAGSIWGN